MARKHTGQLTGIPVTYQTPSPAGSVQMETFIPWTLVKRGVRRQVITPIDAPQEFVVEAALEKRERETYQDSPLLRALGLAHYWQRLLDDGKMQTIGDIAQMEEMDITQVRRLLRLALLAPSFLEVIVAKAELTPINLEFVLRRSMPDDWDAQRVLLAA
ncbi:MAG: hypothetical protein GZ093_10960 [Rhodoferax sp.]|nr:hypothetical protein [Rhodoferax sp.]NDP39252.1 hypothetical protein [Rhodoferax sp.]